MRFPSKFFGKLVPWKSRFHYDIDSLSKIYENIWRFGNSATLRTKKEENNYFSMSYGTHFHKHLRKTMREFVPIISSVG